MTTTEKTCRIMGQAPPNQDQETGLHYGVIPENDLNPDALDSIYYDGTDLGYEFAKSEFEKMCKSAACSIATDSVIGILSVKYHLGPKPFGNKPEDLPCSQYHDDLRDAIAGKLSAFYEIANEDGTELIDCALEIMDHGDYSETSLSEIIQNHFEDSFNDMMSNSCCESGPYRYEDDGYIIEQGGGGDLFVIKSPYFTFCRECSPCAPNAGYLTNPGSMPTYCLGPEWFDNDEPPYNVFNVKDGSVVYEMPAPQDAV